MVEGPQALSKTQRLQTLVGSRLIEVISQNDPGRGLQYLPIENNGPIVTKVVCVGKEVFIVSIENIIRLHFGMNGSERIMNHIEQTIPMTDYFNQPHNFLPRQSRKKLSAAIKCDRHVVLFFDTSICMKPNSYLETVLLRSSQDIMKDAFNPQLVQTLLSRDSRPIYEAIMDQEVTPGVGNVIKCEALFNAKIHPYSISSHIPTDKLTDLIAKLRSFAHEWYNCKQRRREIEKSVYGKDVCKRCQKTVRLVRSGVLQRITYYCEGCQVNYCERVAVNNDNSNPPAVHIGDGKVPTATEEEAKASNWRCSYCTFINTANGLFACEICEQIPNSNDRKRSASLLEKHDNSNNNSNDSSNINSNCDNSDINLSIRKSSSSSESVSIDSKSSHTEIAIGNGQEAMESRLPYLMTPLCKCKAPSLLVRVRKSGPTENRLFWSCAKRNKKCDYFHWADGLFPKCPHHGNVCILRRVLKDGQNNGRYFFACPSVCSTFIWAETVTTTGNSSKKLKFDNTIQIPL